MPAGTVLGRLKMGPERGQGMIKKKRKSNAYGFFDIWVSKCFRSSVLVLQRHVIYRLKAKHALRLEVGEQLPQSNTVLQTASAQSLHTIQENTAEQIHKNQTQ